MRFSPINVESEVMSWSAEEDAALMANLRKAHDRLNAVGRLGPAARLDVTKKARPCAARHG